VTIPDVPPPTYPALSPLDRLLGDAAPPGQRAAELARLVRDRLGLTEDATVTVQQLTCREPGCPPIETVIAVLGPVPRRWTIHRPLLDVDDVLVTALLDHDPQGEPA
jgi:hypothetical protein